ncbi:DegT/DnrJ/EryC1/StrS aminotransferase family protein [Alphaproteobacteria bacterium]|nr:DegT/DnrJ/EryC1/StrS aminotransferase family protein [Alphaproteobacteria bacterium]
MISYFSPWPCYTKEESDAVGSVLLSNKVNYWTGGIINDFEREFAEFVGTKFGIALSNGTVALDLAIKALGLGKDDEVIVTSRTFIASVSSIVNSGAVPVFADVSKKSQNIYSDSILQVLSPNTKAIMCVHLAGWPCDMDPIMELARKHDLFVIEDCAQAHGAKYKGKSVGSIGHIGCWSFCQDKIMTTGGEGGMVTTNSREFWSRMWSYKDHGKSWEAVYERNHSHGFTWLHDSFGTNWRMTEMQAAIGLIQLKRMPDWHHKRNQNMKQIWAAANETNHLYAPTFSCDGCVGSCDAKTNCLHAAYKCYVFVNGSRDKRDSIMKAINAEGVPCYQGSCSEVYLEKAFDNTGLRPKKRLPAAKKLGDISLVFLCHPTLTREEIDKTCAIIKNVCSNITLS